MTPGGGDGRRWGQIACYGARLCRVRARYAWCLEHTWPQVGRTYNLQTFAQTGPLTRGAHSIPPRAPGAPPLCVVQLGRPPLPPPPPGSGASPLAASIRPHCAKLAGLSVHHSPAPDCTPQQDRPWVLQLPRLQFHHFPKVLSCHFLLTTLPQPYWPPCSMHLPQGLCTCCPLPRTVILHHPVIPAS